MYLVSVFFNFDLSLDYSIINLKTVNIVFKKNLCLVILQCCAIVYYFFVIFVKKVCINGLRWQASLGR